MRERVSRMKCGKWHREDDESDNRLELRELAGVLIPEQAWGRNYWSTEPTKRKPLKPTVCQSLSLIPLGYRMWRRVRDEKSRGVGQFMDPFSDWQHDTSHGVPLGGIGCGSFGRGWRGDFRRYSTGSSTTGVVYISDDTPHTCFSICTNTRSSKTPSGRVLKVASSGDNPTASVRYLNPSNSCESYSLYPRAWSVYDSPTASLMDPNPHRYILTCEQISPVIADNYTDSCLPVGVFEWTIENIGDELMDVSLMFTAHNGTTLGTQKNAGAHSEPLADRACVYLSHPIGNDPGSFCLSVEAPHDDDAAPDSEPSIASVCKEWPAECFNELFTEFLNKNGKLPRHRLRQSGPQVGNCGGIGAVSCSVQVPPGKKRSVVFSASWDFPVARFDQSDETYLMKYTNHYGSNGKASIKIAQDALQRYKSWQSNIIKWQYEKVLKFDIPSWMGGMIINEGYFLTAGGSVWTVDGGFSKNKTGHWLYLEGMEYRMFNTYDVHFYASFALATLFPLIERSLIEDIKFAIGKSDHESITYLHSGEKGPRKTRAAVPHDLGGPTESPWTKQNIYCIHNTAKWKDLPMKYVLMTYRDYKAFGDDKDFLSDMWESVSSVMEVTRKNYDPENTGMVKNSSWPDQTYDAWTSQGVTAYCGGLWLASLRVMEEIANILGHESESAKYKALLAKAQRVYSTLWNSNGGYYNYDSSKSAHHDSIMSDQCCGEWYIRCCGLRSVLPPSNAVTALKAVYKLNVLKFGLKCGTGSHRGVVNGMRPNGSIDTTSMQSMECWAGTSFSIVSNMLLHNMKDEAIVTMKGLYDSIYSDFGFWFNTPEAWLHDGSFRSVGYMRPLCAWSIPWALQSTSQQHE
eukprot:TRINITY_DN10069_c0_g1_i1.p1 TRINITY_DN10069_c0_g1~~TRINITY_DN10069_c0_g1_i1.p1  ORF type:complete len:856 (+),score=82.28 TRINITY_DN10069_c0_g1_i1:69-2636(+)